MAFSGAGGTLGVNLEDTYASADELAIFGFSVGSAIIGVNGYSYVFTQNGGTAIPPSTEGAPEAGVPANAFYWARGINHGADDEG